MDLKNDVQVDAFLINMVAEPVVDMVTGKILSLLRDNILKYAYQKDETVAYYLGGTQVPSFEFLHAFKWKSLRKTSRNIIGELFYDWASMRYDSSTYKHGNPYSGGDHRQDLVDTLNKAGYTSSHPWLARRVKPYWDITIEHLFNRRRIDIEVGHAVRKLSGQLGISIKKTI